MKRIKIVRSVLVASALVLLIGFNSYAQRGPGRGQGFRDGSGPRQEMMGDRIANYLDLTEDQRENIEKLRLDFQKGTLQKRNEIAEKRARIHTLVTSDNVNQSEVNQLIDEIGALTTQILKSRMDTHLKVRNELTEEQRIKFDSHFQRGFGKGFGRHGGRGMHGRGWN